MQGYSGMQMRRGRDLFVQVVGVCFRESVDIGVYLVKGGDYKVAL